jgi:hypothetical protein
MSLTIPTLIYAQDEAETPERTVVEVASLFEYPVAPDSLPDIASRSNYVIEQFWKDFDFNQTSVAQIALNHAMGVYTTAMRWADQTVVDKSLDSLFKNLSKNTTLTYQFTKAAEVSIYDPTAPVWIDEVYIKFLNTMLSNKKISDVRKAKYKAQLVTLKNSLKGQKLQPFTYQTVEKKTNRFETIAPFTLLEFGSPSCADCRLAKLKLETNSEISDLLEQGKLDIYFIVPDADSEDGWEYSLLNYPYNWRVGVGEALDEVYDIRTSPTLYLLDSNGVILEKNLGIEEMISIIQRNTNK